MAGRKWKLALTGIMSGEDRWGRVHITLVDKTPQDREDMSWQRLAKAVRIVGGAGAARLPYRLDSDDGRPSAGGVRGEFWVTLSRAPRMKKDMWKRMAAELKNQIVVVTTMVVRYNFIDKTSGGQIVGVMLKPVYLEAANSVL